MCVRERECVCVCERERETHRERECACVFLSHTHSLAPAHAWRYPLPEPAAARPIFRVAGFSQVDKLGTFRCMVCSNRGRDTGVVRSILGAISSHPIVAFRE